MCNCYRRCVFAKKRLAVVFDFVVYLECDRELRLSREAEETKINIDKFSNRYWPAEDHYLAEEQPLRKADLIFKIG